MTIRYPGELIVDRLLWERPSEAMNAARFAAAIGGQVLLTTESVPGLTYHEWQRSRRITWREFDRDTLYVAPWWLAWLYRWLPHSVGWYGKQFDSVVQAPFFLWSLHAMKWNLGWLPKRRALRYGEMRLGVLRFNQRALTL